MKSDKQSRTPVQRFIHYGTIIGILVFAIPAGLNADFIPIVLLLMGINLFNSVSRLVKGKMVMGLAIACVLPVVLYLTIVGLK